MIYDASESITNYLRAIAPAALMTWDVPFATDDEGSKKPLTLHLCLCDMRESVEQRLSGFRRQPAENEATVKIKKPPVRLNLSYIIMVSGGGVMEQQKTLSSILAHFLGQSVVPANYLVGQCKEGENTLLPLSTAQPCHPFLEAGAALWRTTGGDIRPFVAITTQVLIEPLDVPPTPLVREATLKIGSGNDAQRIKQPVTVGVTRVAAMGRLTEQTEIKGQVTERPLENVQVWAEDEKGVRFPLASGRSDPQGFWALFCLPAGKARLHFERRGYEPEVVEIKILAEGQTHLLMPTDLRMKKQGPI